MKLAYDACIQTRVAGSASITLCTLHPRTGALSTFYVGDSVYGIFKKDGAEVVPEMEIAVNYAKMVGTRYDLKGGQS